MNHEERLLALMLGALSGLMITHKDLMLPFERKDIDLIFKEFLGAEAMKFRRDSILLAKQVLKPEHIGWDQLDILAKKLLALRRLG